MVILQHKKIKEVIAQSFRLIRNLLYLSNDNLKTYGKYRILSEMRMDA